MSKLLPVLLISFVGCSKHPTEDGANESETGTCIPARNPRSPPWFRRFRFPAACIDLMTTAETCYFGLTCAELLVSPCDPAHPCYQHWVAFRDAGCELDTAPLCG